MLILVNGLPGSGKTTLAVPLARRLGIPLMSKDTVKEALLDALGAGDPDWSRRLGRASFVVMFALAAQAPAVVLEAPFTRRSVPDLLALRSRPIEVYCRCPADELVRRYATRVRHPGHFDGHRLAEVRAAAARQVPLGIGPVLEVDTTRPVDLDAVAVWALRHRSDRTAGDLDGERRTAPGARGAPGST